MSETAIDNPRDGEIADTPPWRRVVAIELLRLLAIAVVVGAVVAAFLPKRAPAILPSPPTPPGWTTVEWPYLRDQFDPGVALRCAGPDCSVALDITIRPKRGFCDCERGVYDDTQLQEVGDLDLTRIAFVPTSPGETVQVAGLSGRLRTHRAQNGESAVSAALHKGCDMIAIVARGQSDAGLADAMLAFLRQPAVAAWIADLLNEKPQT